VGNIFTVTSESSPDYDLILVGILRSYTQTNFLIMDAKSFASMSKDQIRRAFSAAAMSEEHAIFKVAKLDFFDLIFLKSRPQQLWEENSASPIQPHLSHSL